MRRSWWTWKCKVKQTIQPKQTKLQKEIILISYEFWRDRNEGAETWSLNLIYIRMLRSFKLCQSRRRGELCKKKRENLKEASSPIWGEYSILLYFLIVISARAAPSPGLISQLWQHLDYTSTDCKHALAANPVYPIVHCSLLWNRIWLPKILPTPPPHHLPLLPQCGLNLRQVAGCSQHVPPPPPNSLQIEPIYTEMLTY